MFVDNTRKVICLSVFGTDYEFARDFLKSQFENNSITVNWLSTKPNVSSQEELEQIKQNIQNNPDSVRINELCNISELIDGNCLSFPISEYDVYAICSDPIYRIIRINEFILNKRRVDENKKYLSRLEQTRTAVGDPEQTIEVPLSLTKSLSDAVKEQLHLQFVDNVSEFAPERHRNLTKIHFNQVFWLKHDNQNINHIYKYNNYNQFVVDICAKYNLDASSYDDNLRLTCRETNLTADDISQEIKDKILEKFADDKALYDSL